MCDWEQVNCEEVSSSAFWDVEANAAMEDGDNRVIQTVYDVHVQTH